MQISREFLMEAVGLSLMVALIFIGLQMFQRTMKVTAILENNQEEKIAMLEEYEIVKYDGFVIDGMTAVNYIKNMVVEYELPVVVEFGQKTFVVSDRTELGLLRDVDSEKYINPYATYCCMVVRDDNEAVNEIRLVRE